MRTRIIRTIDELIYFLRTNWHNVTDEQYKLMIYEAFKIHSEGKPKNKTKALKMIRTHYELAKETSPQIKKPLFIETRID